MNKRNQRKCKPKIRQEFSHIIAWIAILLISGSLAFLFIEQLVYAFIF